MVPFHDFGEINGLLYVTMRLINGRDLQTVLADGPLSPARAVGIIEQTASALHAAHRIGLIHRDVKPSNILVAGNDFAYLIDFRIARAAGETGLTSTGAAIGTWAYMSPERLNTGHADARADIYALTCVLHEALTGQRPYLGDSLEQQIVGHLTSPPPRPSALQPGVPQPLDAVIAKGMAKQPDRRYASTVELVRAARDAITTDPTDPTVLKGRLHAAIQQAEGIHQQPTEMASTQLAPPPQTGAASAARPAVDPARQDRNRRRRGCPCRRDRRPRRHQCGVRIRPEKHIATAHIPTVRVADAVCFLHSRPGRRGANNPANDATPAGKRLRHSRLLQLIKPPVDRPMALTLAGCASAGSWLQDMSWSSWGPQGADGTGIAASKICQPNCASGYQLAYAVVVHAWNPQPAPAASGCPAGLRIFADMILAFPKSVPPPTVHQMNTPYNGMPGVHYTNYPVGSPGGGDFLGRTLCE